MKKNVLNMCCLWERMYIYHWFITGSDLKLWYRTFSLSLSNATFMLFSLFFLLNSAMLCLIPYFLISYDSISFNSDALRHLFSNFRLIFLTSFWGSGIHDILFYFSFFICPYSVSLLHKNISYSSSFNHWISWNPSISWYKNPEKSKYPDKKIKEKWTRK